MKELHFEYRMKLVFDHPVREHRFTLKCIPRSNERQEIRDLFTDVYPKEFLSSSEDSFGNQCIYGFSEGEHDHFSVLVKGTASTGLSPSEAAREDYQLGIFRYQTDYTHPGMCISTFHDRFSFPPETSALEKPPHFLRNYIRISSTFRVRPPSLPLPRRRFRWAKEYVRTIPIFSSPFAVWNGSLRDM